MPNPDDFFGRRAMNITSAGREQASSWRMQSICIAMSFCFASSFVAANEMDMTTSGNAPGHEARAQASAGKAGHLATSDSLGDILHHPAFSGFAPLILPWDGRRYEEDMRLSDIGALLPYHSHVNPKVLVGALNRMIDDVRDGRQVFYDFYTKAQKQEQPGKEHTGLFFLRGKPGAPFAVIAPGGGFSYVGSVHEGFPYAVEINARGYNAFVLKYRTGSGGAVATQDLAAALFYIFANAENLGVSKNGYSLWGSSAGARMAAAIGSHGTSRYGGSDLPKPSTVVIAYTAHSDYSSSEPPTFAVVGDHDGIAPPSTMERRVAALRTIGTQVEFHKFPGVGHGFGPGTGTSAEGWIAAAIRFWERQLPGHQ
jgi:acetyl esterase/lipase